LLRHYRMDGQKMRIPTMWMDRSDAM